ncbi:MAG: sigma-70 family RNA polymerase sigma factor, partial [Olegusella sp.]|nr:sigma-70 family RNA polymerase sigma factor [Olegusella sp.]
MEDARIIDLYFSRSEDAIAQTRRSYGRMIRGVAWGILRSARDTEECESDTYLKAWQAMPPTQP